MRIAHIITRMRVFCVLQIDPKTGKIVGLCTFFVTGQGRLDSVRPDEDSRL
jgi:hypothetical protein